MTDHYDAIVNESELVRRAGELRANYLRAVAAGLGRRIVGLFRRGRQTSGAYRHTGNAAA